MNVREFIDSGEMLTNVKTYVSFVDKQMCALLIAKKSLHNGNDFVVNHVVKYILRNLYLIDKYTDIDVDFDNPVEEYDAASSSGLINNIEVIVGEKEVNEFDKIIELTCNSEFDNRKDVRNLISEHLDGIFNMLSNMQLEGNEVDE